MSLAGVAETISTLEGGKFPKIEPASTSVLFAKPFEKRRSPRDLSATLQISSQHNKQNVDFFECHEIRK
jgi:hypothetical protein